MARSLMWWLGVLGAACGARELDPAACAARFDVQRDKIIRTEESRDMGARYLSELDVGARPECLRLCCETEACDVFVYEEKGPGSCYLFNCGPPEDFRCKFTAHGNFSSGVLALSRRLAELQDRERLALASLRVASSAPPAPAPLMTTTQRATPAPPPPPTSPPHGDLLLTPGRCSRYQFECRHGGECVAVYNACDGVPQCADGSDEAPELGCPPPAPAPRAPPPRTTPGTQESVAQLGEGEGEGGLRGAAGGERWPHRLAQAQPHRHIEPGPSSHIFSHKGGLLQDTEGAPPPAPYPPLEAPYPPFEAPWPRRAWNQQQNMEIMGGWGGGGAPYPRLEWGEGSARRAWPVPARPDPEPASPGELPPAYSARAATLRDSAKKGPEPARPSPAAPSDPPLPPPPPPHQQGAPKPAPQKEKVSAGAPPATPRAAGAPAARVADALREHARAADALSEHARAADGLSEHPPAAVLLLVLGMVMTVGLGGMLGCRAGAARRRLRRSKPLAHDADYLVNGMYL